MPHAATDSAMLPDASGVLASAPCSAPLVCAKLDVLWWGASIGGRHYTGNIIIHDPFRKLEMIRKLGRKEAKELSEREGRMWLSRQTETNKFDSQQKLERHAVAWCKANLGANWCLLDGDEHNPSRVIGAGGWIRNNIRTMNKLARMWDKVPDSRRDFDHPTIRQLYAVWEAQFKEPNVSDQATARSGL